MPLSTARLRRMLDKLGASSLVTRVPLDDLRMLTVGAGVEPAELPIPSPNASGWQPIAAGSRWGGRDLTAWFHATAHIPEDWLARLQAGEAPGGATRRFAVVLRLLLGLGGEVDGFGWPEGLLYVNGRLYQGINRHHPDVLLRAVDVATRRPHFDVRAWSGLLPMDHRIEEAALGLLDRDAEHLYFLLKEGADLVDALGERDPLAHALLGALERAADRLYPQQVATEAYRVAVAAALANLRTRLAELRAEYASRERPSVIALGHGHLDVAWLWQLRHTHEKAARTFAVATTLMEHYPEYHFLHTTPQVFTWLKEEYPDVWQRVVQREREGRFELAGAMWLESDCVLVSGEALVRQIAAGQRFMRDELGHGCEILWLPDAFGYTAALPQIMLRSGLTAFVTTKMSWSETNRIPMDTFRWRGLDGSEVLAHFLTTPTLASDPRWAKMDTYNGSLGIPSVVGAWQRYRQKHLNRELLLAFGYGDGGAGPTRQMLEQARAIQELPGTPELRMGRADETLRRMRERVWAHPRLPVWDGELYFEYHRGTYTTQAWLKRDHRRAEANLLLAELLDAWTPPSTSSPTRGGAVRRGMGPNGGGETPPRAGEGREGSAPILAQAWRTLLLHEFHDILPGSSIHEVYEDAREAFAKLHTTLETFIEGRLAVLATQIEAPAEALLIFNPSPWPRTALVKVEGDLAARAWATPSAQSEPVKLALGSQRLAGEGQQRTLVEVPDVPGLGYRLIVPTETEPALDSEEVEHTPKRRGVGPAVSAPPLEPARAQGHVLENGFFRLELDASGAIASLVDKRVPDGRQLFRPSVPGNQLLLFDDQPEAFDAWNIDATYEARTYPLGEARMEVVESGPLRAAIRVHRPFGQSTITQEISVYRTIPRIDFATRLDWHERHRLLKAAFPFDLRTTRATYEVQYGAVERATHRNTSWDQARFEVWAHRWVDLSESDYGVSLLNDGRYGHDVHDATLRISLARAPTYPDPQADQCTPKHPGEHAFTYSLYPHLGDWREGDTVPAAYALNRPVRVYAYPREETTEFTEHTEEAREVQTGAHLPFSADADSESVSGASVISAGSVVSSGSSSASLFVAEPEAVVIEAVKRAEDGDGLIVRLYEAHGGRHIARVRSLLPLIAVEECDLLERPLTLEGSPSYAAWSESPVASHDIAKWDPVGWSCMLRPFEIRTFRVRV